MIRLVPDTGLITYTAKLSDGLLEQPTLALNAVQASIQIELLTLLRHVVAILGAPDGQRVDLTELQTALDETHAYLDQIHLKTGSGPLWERLVNMIHALDHLQRIHERCEEDEDRAKTAQATIELEKEKSLLINSIEKIMELLCSDRWQAAADRAHETSRQIHQKVGPYRTTTINQVAVGEIDVLTSTERLEAIRWLRRVSKHIRRITYHMGQAILAIGK